MIKYPQADRLTPLRIVFRIQIQHIHYYSVLLNNEVDSIATIYNKCDFPDLLYFFQFNLNVSIIIPYDDTIIRAPSIEFKNNFDLISNLSLDADTDHDQIK